jgi:hypothetical protein
MSLIQIFIIETFMVETDLTLIPFNFANTMLISSRNKLNKHLLKV